MEIIIMRGIPGSGKSTWIENFKERNGDSIVEVVSADHFFLDSATGEYNFNPSKLNEAHAACFARFDAILGLGRYNSSDYLIVDNTNTKLWEMSPYIALANLYRVPVRIVRMGCNASVAAQRNIHGVPAKAVEAMANRIESLLPFWPKEEHVQT